MANASISVRSVMEWVKSSSTFLAVGIVAILLVMMIPLPPFILDLLLSFNITFAIIILLVAIYVLKPLDFSVFPSVLLTATLLRLSLNVASTRLILLHGNEGAAAAGQVIKSFGTFVVGGNFLIGFIVFMVLVLINFIVITKGATRIAEVAARFTLDAMPGKQMSIDADLNTGLISESEARKKRDSIAREADFYGAMDGASKFVRGDAIAGIVITLINIVGGLIVGVLQQGMPVADAARTYTLLTVGDGLVTQIPALVISTGAGMLVTRSTASYDLSSEIKSQIFLQPKAMASASFMLLGFGLIPGMPTIPFLLIASVVAFIAFTVFRSSKQVEEAEEESPAAMPAREPLGELLPLDMLELEVGYNLIPLVDAKQGGELLHRIRTFRRQMTTEMGFIMPSIHIRDNLQIKPGQYVIKLKGVDIARGELMMGHYLVISPEDKAVTIAGHETVEPAFGLPAVWIEEGKKESIQAQGHVVVDPATVLTTHITEVVKAHADELLGRQDVQYLLDNLAQSHPKIVEEIVPNIVSLGTINKVLQELLRERVSIRDLLTIMETLADYAPMTKNVDLLTGYVRQALSRTITHQYVGEDGTMTVVMMSPEVEDTISQSVQHTEYESFVTPDPSIVQKMVSNLQGFTTKFSEKGLQPIVLCSPSVRTYVRKILAKFFPHIVILSHNEISHNVNVKSLGVVGVKDAA